MTPEAPRGAQGGLSRSRIAMGALVAFTALGIVPLVVPIDLGVDVSGWLHTAAAGPWAVPAAILTFVLLASIGAPQVVLITAMVAAFGPWAGFAYSLGAKMVSCAIGFFVGRRFGADILARYSSPDATLLLDDLARNGFWASAVVRLAPTLPSVVVNVAGGCTSMRFRDFIGGALVGSIPVMALTAFAGNAAIHGLSGAGLRAWLSVGGAILLMIFITWLGRRWVKHRLEARRSEADRAGPASGPRADDVVGG